MAYIQIDLQNVHLVGVLNADHLLNFPDFRAHERTYQMLSQVSGRAGRKNIRGKVLIQTYQPQHPIIQQVIRSDYEGMLDQQLEERIEYHYPPYYRLIKMVVKHRDVEKVRIASKWIFNVLNQSYKGEILGPVFPPIARLRNRYHMQILIKIGKDQSRNELKKLIDNLPLFLQSNLTIKVSVICIFFHDFWLVFIRPMPDPEV